MAWVWGAARALGGRVGVRMEDHDRGRCRPEYERAILDALDWLGLAADDDSLRSLRGGPSLHRQSDAADAYAAALESLAGRGLVYGCDCSRSTIARQLGDGLVAGEEPVYPGTCRDRGLRPGPGVGVRLRLSEAVVRFEDLRLGPVTQQPDRQCGDLLVRDRNGHWTYQFCVTVDDLRHGVTLVVRGEDLLASTGRQILLARLLGRERPPAFLHHPLIRNARGEKLAKRARAPALGSLRGGGATPGDLLGDGLHRTGALPGRAPVEAQDLGAVIGTAMGWRSSYSAAP